MKLPRDPLCDRIEFLLDRARGKNVLSVGLGGQPHDVDYAFNFTTDDISGTFSARLAAVADTVTFVDISAAAIERFSGSVPGAYHLIDITTDPADWPLPLRTARPDMLILGEVIEHIDDPGSALRNVATLLASHAELIITTPNAFNLSMFLRVVGGSEPVHPEHVAYYSASTLTRLLECSGFDVTDIRFTRVRRPTLRQGLRRPAALVVGWLTERRPQLGRSVVVVAEHHLDP